MKRKSKAEIERERVEKEQRRIQKERLQAEKKRAQEIKLAKQREEAKRREWLREQRSKPRTELPSAYAGESIQVHKRILDGFMKQVGKKLEINTYKAVGGSGGKLVIEYTTRHGGHGTLELNDLGPMPIH